MKMNDTEYKNLWDKVADMLTKLSKKDDVVYRVKATPESVDAKLCKIGEGR